ncbi:MAG: acyltransferase [Asticcacaulis sp.]
MQQIHLKPLTSLRFFAALWVVLYTYIHELSGNVSLSLLDKGYLGVDLFFILSGFILSYVYLQSFGEKRFSYSRFTVLRLARVYPLHLATLLFTLLLIVAAHIKGMQLDSNAENWSALPAHIFLMQSWGLASTAAFNHPSWSISAEWFAYLCFPLVAFVAWRLRERPVLAVALAMILLVAINLIFEVVAGFSLTQATFEWGALRVVPTFLYGSALFLAWRSGAVAKPAVAMAGTAVALAAIIVTALTSQSDILIVMALGLLVLCVAGLAQTSSDPDSNPKGGFMSSRILVYLGEISFATYMIYVPWKWVYLKGVEALLGTGKTGLPLTWWLAGLVALIPLSMLAHHLIERPFRKHVCHLGDRFLSRFNYVSVKQS